MCQPRREASIPWLGEASLSGDRPQLSRERAATPPCAPCVVMAPGSARRNVACAIGQQLQYRRAARRHCRHDPPQCGSLFGLVGEVQLDQGLGVVHVEMVGPDPVVRHAPNGRLTRHLAPAEVPESGYRGRAIAVRPPARSQPRQLCDGCSVGRGLIRSASR